MENQTRSSHPDGLQNIGAKVEHQQRRRTSWIKYMVQEKEEEEAPIVQVNTRSRM